MKYSFTIQTNGQRTIAGQIEAANKFLAKVKLKRRFGRELKNKQYRIDVKPTQ